MVGLPQHHAHDHEWHMREDESGLEYEDAAVIIFEECEFVEITGSSTCERLDETFYETGYECEASRKNRFDLVGIERLHGLADQHEDFAETLCEGRDDVLEAHDRDPILVEEIELRAAEVLCDGTDGQPEALDWMYRWYDGQTTFHITIEVSHSHGRTFEYELTYEHTEVTVDE